MRRRACAAAVRLDARPRAGATPPSRRQAAKRPLLRFAATLRFAPGDCVSSARQIAHHDPLVSDAAHRPHRSPKDHGQPNATGERSCQGSRSSCGATAKRLGLYSEHAGGTRADLSARGATPPVDAGADRVRRVSASLQAQALSKEARSTPAPTSPPALGATPPLDAGVDRVRRVSAFFSSAGFVERGAVNARAYKAITQGAPHDR